MRNIPIVTKNLLIVNVVAFLLTFLMGKDASGGYALNDIFGLHFFLASDFQIYQLFTYMFMHGGFEHILFNMFALWMFGCVVERVWGAKKFLFYYIACGVGAGLFQEAAQFVQFYVKMSDFMPGITIGNIFSVSQNLSGALNSWTTVGASGAIYAILLAFGMIFPEDRIFIFPIPVPIKAKYFVIGYWRKQIDGGYGGSRAKDAFAKMRDTFAGKHRKQQFTYTRNENFTDDERQQDWDYNKKKQATQEEIDRILDKIRKNGYDSLTKEEKQILFDQSNK